MFVGRPQLRPCQDMTGDVLDKKASVFDFAFQRVRTLDSDALQRDQAVD